MTEQAHDHVDWAEVERRGRRRNLLGFVPALVVLGSIVVLTGRFGFWEGGAAWLAVGGLLLLGLVGQAVSVSTTRLRARTAEGLRMQYALSHQLDPGPELRGKLDLYARRMAGNAWLVWLFPLLPVSFLLQGRWDRPLLAVPAAVVLVSAAVAFAFWWRRQTAAARRWIADPPGPQRTVPPPNAWERWLSGRRFMWLSLGFVVVNAAVLAVLVLVLR